MIIVLVVLGVLLVIAFVLLAGCALQASEQEKRIDETETVSADLRQDLEQLKEEVDDRKLFEQRVRRDAEKIYDRALTDAGRGIANARAELADHYLKHPPQGEERDRRTGEIKPV